VLIRVLKASICGTDVHIYNWDAWAQKGDSGWPMTLAMSLSALWIAWGHVKGLDAAILVAPKGTSPWALSQIASRTGGICVQTRKVSALIVRRLGGVFVAIAGELLACRPIDPAGRAFLFRPR